MQRRFAFAICPAKRLAIDRKVTSLDGLSQALDPQRKGIAKPLGIQQTKDATDAVVRRNAIVEVEKRAEKLKFIMAILFDFGDVVAPTDDSTDGQGYNIPQAVKSALLASRITEAIETLSERASGFAYFEGTVKRGTIGSRNGKLLPNFGSKSKPLFT